MNDFFWFSELMRDIRGTATSIWAITRIINLLVIFRVIRSMPHFTNYGVIMGTINDGMKNLKAFIGILIVSRSSDLKDEQSNIWRVSLVSHLRLCCSGNVALSRYHQTSNSRGNSVRIAWRYYFKFQGKQKTKSLTFVITGMPPVVHTNRVIIGRTILMTFS